MQKLPNEWLYEEHSKKQIQKWATQLNYFYFRRASGGQSSDDDEFLVSFSYTEKNELLEIFAKLQLKLGEINSDAERIIPGKPYTPEQTILLKHETNRFPDIEQPGITKIFDKPVFIWINDDSVTISVSRSRSPHSFGVSNKDFEICISLEKEFDQQNLSKIIQSPNPTDINSITKNKYPEIFNADNYSDQKSWWNKLFKK